MWQRTLSGEPVALEQKADLLLAGAHAATTGASVTDAMHRIAGTTGIYAKNPLERLFRDAQTVRHHGFVSEGRFEAAGQVYLGGAARVRHGSILRAAQSLRTDADVPWRPNA